MKLTPFALERYFARHEFSARYLLSCSDCEAFSLSDLLRLASPDDRAMWDELRLGYTESPGHPALRQEIASLYRSLGAEQLLVMTPEEGIFLSMHALLKPGDHVVVTYPGYQSLYEVARAIGCQVSNWQPRERDGWWFDLGELEKLLRSDTRLVVVNFPHNPTGSLLSVEEYNHLVELLRQRGIFLFSDEMYRFLEIYPGTTLPSGCELYENAVTLFGMSKTFGMPGLRVGWLASQQAEFLQQVAILKDYTTICNSAPSEILALIALHNRQAIIQQQLERVRRNLAALENFMHQHRRQFAWLPPRGGSICFPRLLQVEDSAAFCEQLIGDTGILLVPSRLFQAGDHHVRIGYGRENLPQVLAHFAAYLERHSQ